MKLPKIDLPTYKLLLPSSGKTITFRPFTVKEQKIFLMAVESEKVGDINDAIRQIVVNCVISEEPIDPDEFTYVDLEWFFINLRARSINEIIDMNFFCKNEVDGKSCDNNIELKYNILTDTKIIHNAEHDGKIALTQGVGITLKPPTISTEDEEDTADLAMAFIAECVESIFTEDEVILATECSLEEIVEFLEGLPKYEFDKIEKYFDTLPHIEKNIKTICGKCGYEHVVEMKGLTSFFD